MLSIDISTVRGHINYLEAVRIRIILDRAVLAADILSFGRKNDITAGDTNKLFASVKISTKAKSNIDGFTISLNDVLADTTTPADDIDMDELLANVKAYINNKEVGKVTINEDAIRIINSFLDNNSILLMHVIKNIKDVIKMHILIDPNMYFCFI